MNEGGCIVYAWYYKQIQTTAESMFPHVFLARNNMENET